MTELKIPDHTLVAGGKKGRLDEDYFWLTEVKVSQVVRCGKIELFPEGTLLLKQGFVWDFATGAIDDPAMVAASAVHDAFCRLTDKGRLPWSLRKAGDKEFKRVLKAGGVGWFRRRYAYLAVRAYSIVSGAIHRWNGDA